MYCCINLTGFSPNKLKNIWTLSKYGYAILQPRDHLSPASIQSVDLREEGANIFNHILHIWGGRVLGAVLRNNKDVWHLARVCMVIHFVPCKQPQNRVPVWPAFEVWPCYAVDSDASFSLQKFHTPDCAGWKSQSFWVNSWCANPIHYARRDNFVEF